MPYPTPFLILKIKQSISILFDWVPYCVRYDDAEVKLNNTGNAYKT